LSIQRLAIRALLAAVLIASPGLAYFLDSDPSTSADLRKIELQVHQAVNKARSSRHLPELAWNEPLAAEARRHAARIVDAHFFAHRDPVRGDIDRRLDRSGIEWMRCAENLYEGDSDELANEAVKTWLLSEGHRKNIMDSMFSDAGVGVAVKRDRTLVIVQEFIFK
jgi:uncharacterized protein YkwD